MEIFVATIHVIVALFMILVVLIQGGNQGGIGAAFGGGNSQGVFGASGATSFLGKLTYAAAMVFMTTSVALAIIQGKGGDVGLSDKLKAKSAETQGVVAPDSGAEKPQSESVESDPVGDGDHEAPAVDPDGGDAATPEMSEPESEAPAPEVVDPEPEDESEPEDE